MMKRIFAVALLTLCALPVLADQKLKVIDLSDGEPLTAEQIERNKERQAAQDAAASIPPQEAKDFMLRLVSTVDKGLELAQSGSASGVQVRNQAIALNKLQNEGARFSTLFTPFHDCNTASIDAATAWQQLISNDTQRFNQTHQSYQAAVVACLKAATNPKA